MGLLIGITLATLGISALCSLFEAVLYSSRMGTLEAARKENPHDTRAKRMILLKQKISVPIAAILVLNTVANTAGATLAGLVSAQVLPAAYVPIYTIGLVLGILFLSEIIPKTYGAVHWRGIWRHIVWPLVWIKNALYPLVVVAQWLTSKLAHQAAIPSVTEEEILAMVQLGATEGHISHSESRLVRNIIRMEDINARDILTPRIVMFTLEETMSVTEAVERIQESGFTRIPIYGGEPENVTGYVMCVDLYRTQTTTPDLPLRDLAKPISFVPESANCLSLLNQFIKNRTHLAMVADEYGGVAGLLSLEDLVETLLGSEIVDETDSTIDMRTKAKFWRTTSAPRSTTNHADEPPHA